MKPFLLTATGILHDARHAGERCNTDDAIEKHRLSREEVEALRPLRLCAHCWPAEVRR